MLTLAAFTRARNSWELPGKYFPRNKLSMLRVYTSGRSRESNAPFLRRVAPQLSTESAKQMTGALSLLLMYLQIITAVIYGAC